MLISVLNLETGKWEIKTLEQAGITKHENHFDRPINADAVNDTAKAWNWLCLNGEWSCKDKVIYYSSKSIIEALKIAANI